jgi:Holliday junction resolvase
MSRRKGAAAEREVAGLLTEGGFTCNRNVEGSRGQACADIDNDLGLYIEVRRRETLNIPAWNREIAEKKGDKIGVLAYRRSREGWHVSMSFEDFLTLLDHAHNGPPYGSLTGKPMPW